MPWLNPLGLWKKQKRAFTNREIATIDMRNCIQHIHSLPNPMTVGLLNIQLTDHPSSQTLQAKIYGFIGFQICIQNLTAFNKRMLNLRYNKISIHFAKLPSCLHHDSLSKTPRNTILLVFCFLLVFLVVTVYWNYNRAQKRISKCFANCDRIAVLGRAGSHLHMMDKIMMKLLYYIII